MFQFHFFSCDTLCFLHNSHHESAAADLRLKHFQTPCSLGSTEVQRPAGGELHDLLSELSADLSPAAACRSNRSVSWLMNSGGEKWSPGMQSSHLSCGRRCNKAISERSAPRGCTDPEPRRSFRGKTDQTPHPHPPTTRASLTSRCWTQTPPSGKL